MSDDWYYAVGQDRQGPVGENEIARLARSGEIGPQTWIWRAGMAEWKPAGEALPGNLRPAGWPGAAAPPAPMRETRQERSYSPAPAAANRGGYAAASNHPSGFVESVQAVLRKYATFTGRARRPEYWWFTLFSIIVSILTLMVDVTLFGLDSGVSPLNTIWGLAMLIPGLAVTARRLHDTGRSAWWILIVLIPLIGAIVLLVFLVTKGEENDNQYGPA